MKKYLRLAEKIIEDIQASRLKNGERMLSLRLFAKQHNVSVSTAVSCYEELEKRGWVEARPQSGFFICNKVSKLPAPSWQSFETQIAVPERILDKVDVETGPLGIASIELDASSQRALDKSFRRVMMQAGDRLSLYPDKRGEPVLREALATHFSHLGFALNEEELVITHGCMDAVKTALMICTEPGDTVAISSPCYNGLLDLLSKLGLKVIEIPSLPEGVDLDELQRLFEQNLVQAGLFCTTHMNPQGITMTSSQKQRLAELATRYRIPVIEDDVYFELNHSGTLHLPTAYYDRNGYVIWCGSFSKTLSPSYRLGWCQPGKFLSEYQKLYEGVPTLIQYAVADFIKSGSYSRHLKRVRLQLAENKRNYTHHLAQRLPENSRITQPDGGLVLWIQVERLNAKLLAQNAVKAGLDIRVGSEFTESTRYEDCLRVNMGYSWSSNIELLIDQLLELIVLSRDSDPNNCRPSDVA